MFKKDKDVTMGNQQERLSGMYNNIGLGMIRSSVLVSQESSEAICHAPEFLQGEDMVRPHMRVWEGSGTETTTPLNLRFRGNRNVQGMLQVLMDPLGHYGINDGACVGKPSQQIPNMLETPVRLTVL